MKIHRAKTYRACLIALCALSVPALAGSAAAKARNTGTYRVAQSPPPTTDEQRQACTPDVFRLCVRAIHPRR